MNNYPFLIAFKCMVCIVSVGVILVAKYQRIATPINSPMSKVSKTMIVIGIKLAWWTWSMDTVKTEMIKMGGNIWVKGGELVNPLWLILRIFFDYYRLQQSKVLSYVFPLISN